MPAVEVRGFHHFSLLSRNLERSAAFYEGILGLQRKFRPDLGTPGIWYEIAGQEFHIILSDDLPTRHEGHPALEVSDIAAAVVAVREAGAEVQQDVFLRTHDNSHSAFVRDPDGNLLEFTQHS
jgi:catechol 2,3-dioxygenase-like lactoylglutathione lyase family enzyme